MYSGYGAASPPLTNNPFISTGGSISQRFPDISGTSPQQNQYSSQWNDPNAMYAQQQAQQQQMLAQQQYDQQQQYYQQQQQQAMYQQPQTSGYSGFGSPSPSGFQPSSSFGQQMAANISGSSYGYLNGNSGGHAQSTAYNPAAQQLQSNPNYVAAFDPYASSSQGWGDPTSNSNMTGGGQQMSSGGYGVSGNSGMGGMNGLGYGGGGSGSGSHFVAPSGAAGYSASGDPHPREYIRTHKAQVEAWDSYAWKQLLGSFETLKREWEKRREELKAKAAQAQSQAQQMQMQYGMYGGGFALQQLQQEAARLQGLHKDADANCDTVSASTFQMQEVFQGYRQSGDAASKRRVREATNASLQGLPGWPGPY